MSKPKYKYFLNPGVKGDLYTKKGKIVLDKAGLSQEDLEYLYETEGQTNIIARVETPAGTTAEAGKKPKAKDKDEKPSP